MRIRPRQQNHLREAASPAQTQIQSQQRQNPREPARQHQSTSEQESARRPQQEPKRRAPTERVDGEGPRSLPDNDDRSAAQPAKKGLGALKTLLKGTIMTAKAGGLFSQSTSRSSVLTKLPEMKLLNIDKLAVVKGTQFDLRHSNIDRESIPHRVPNREDNESHANKAAE